MRVFVLKGPYGRIIELIRRPDAEELSIELPNLSPEYIELVNPPDSISPLTHYIDNTNQAIAYTAEQTTDMFKIKPEGWQWQPINGGWVDTRTAEQRFNDEWESVRHQRNQLLQNSDWTVLPDSPISGELKEAWVAYRQTLRDVTLQPDPFNITWPTAPGN